MINIKNLKDGDLLEGELAVRSKDGVGEGLRDYSNKLGRFFVIKVGNSEGDLTLKYWGGKNPEKASSLFSEIDVGDVISVKGRCTHDSYSKELVISVNEEVKYGAAPESIKKLMEGDYRPEDFIPTLPKEKIEALYSDLQTFVKSVEHPHLGGLLISFFEDPDFKKVLKRTPAARRHHHNYLGGLLEHSVNVAKLCETLSSFYGLDRDILISGALLHDIGKTREYQIKASIDVSNEGRLIGHLTITADMVRNRIKDIDGFPNAVKNKLIHMILSHHGELEKGSPKEPAFPEAMALYHADYMDAFVKNTLQEIERAEEGDEWVYSKSMRKFLHTK
jgi:3'-5' exoribonuclease